MCWCACMHTGVVYVSLFCMTVSHVLCLKLCVSWRYCNTLWPCIFVVGILGLVSVSMCNRIYGLLWPCGLEHSSASYSCVVVFVVVLHILVLGCVVALCRIQLCYNHPW